MSSVYWIIQGIGINANEIESRIDEDKALKLLYEQYPNVMDLERILQNPNFCAKKIGHCGGFENLADALCYCDDTDTLTYAGDGEGNWYFYYPPSMPWHQTKNEPKSEEEVVARIVSAVQRLTDMSHDEIEKLIDFELYVVGSE